MQFVLAAVIGITLFVLVQLIRKDASNQLSVRVAVLIQMLWLIRFFVFYMKADFDGAPHPIFIIYDQTFFLLDGPLIWFYTRSLIEKNPFSIESIIHFLPFSLIFGYSTFLLIAYPEAIVEEYMNSISMIEEGKSMVDIFDLIYILFFLGISLVYLYKSVSIARSYNSQLADNYSTLDNLTANWIITFQRFWMGLFLLPIIIYFINYIWPVVNNFTLAAIVLLALAVFSLFFSSNLLRQVYKPIGSFQQATTNPAPRENKVDRSELERLKSLLEKEKYYLDEELSLGQLAEHMKIKPAQLTELIKGSEYENFYDLINSFRIEEVKDNLKTSNEQIIQLAYQNGFRSKSTFNKIFKEKTGMTPKEYRLSLK